MTLTMGIYFAIAFMGILVALWIYRRGKAEGRSEQADEDMEAFNGILREVAPEFYANNFGTHALSVLDLQAWGDNTGAKPKFRLVSDKRDGRAGSKAGDGDKRKGRKRQVHDG